MTAQGHPTPISERVRLVIELTRINSEHLRGKSRFAGVEIELESALAASRPEARTSQQLLRIEMLRDRLWEADRCLSALEEERARLEAALANVEAATRTARDRDPR
ncbi:hypothetical protein [Caballeronia glebae]|jgi:hypothetical protein|uniref:Uncharacterized protein n=1 Tax=Caballeronia glebae TaxID=1777143 RepID=A0A158CLY2_9BURK|nr:hypothetical protein [Caballeronia glebae]SAK83365.1 hypothetical protein AWB82_05577 [Caballeronia glebae]